MQFNFDFKKIKKKIKLDKIQQLFDFFSSPSYTRTLALIGILIIAVALPVTITVLQQRTQTQQHASGFESCVPNGMCYAANKSCPNGYHTGSTTQNNDCENDYSNVGDYQCCLVNPTPRPPTPTPVPSNTCAYSCSISRNICIAGNGLSIVAGSCSTGNPCCKPLPTETSTPTPYPDTCTSSATQNVGKGYYCTSKNICGASSNGTQAVSGYFCPGGNVCCHNTPPTPTPVTCSTYSGGTYRCTNYQNSETDTTGLHETCGTSFYGGGNVDCTGYGSLCCLKSAIVTPTPYPFDPSKYRYTGIGGCSSNSICVVVEPYGNNQSGSACNNIEAQPDQSYIAAHYHYGSTSLPGQSSAPACGSSIFSVPHVCCDPNNNATPIPTPNLQTCVGQGGSCLAISLQRSSCSSLGSGWTNNSSYDSTCADTSGNGAICCIKNSSSSTPTPTKPGGGGNPTPTAIACTNKDTQVSLALSLPGINPAGDANLVNTNPQHVSWSNGQVRISQRGSTSTLASKSNHTFSHNSGKFNEDTSDDFASLACSNNYSVHVKIPLYAWSSADISYGNSNSGVTITMIPGDANGDGRVNIAGDWSFVAACKDVDPDTTIPNVKDNNGNPITTTCRQVFNFLDFQDGGTSTTVFTPSGVSEWSANYNDFLRGLVECSTDSYCANAPSQ